MKLGILGGSSHPWPSVDRTRCFYLRALGADMEITHAEEQPGGGFASPPDAVLSFSGSRGWQLDPHPDCPLLFALHGGPVLNQDFLQAHLGRLQTTDVLIVNCASDVEILRGMFAGAAPRICHLPLPVDPEIFRPLPREECREAVSLESADFVLGFVARLLPQKNLHRFLRLLDELRRLLAPRRVAGVVVGSYWVDYPVLPYVTEEYPNRIAALLESLGLAPDVAWFHAGLGDEDLALCYGALDLLVHPTTAVDENFGYVPVEAMACGVPVLGAAYGGLKDTVVDGETGFLMPTWPTRSGLRMDLLRGRDDALRLLGDAGLRERMAGAALARAREVYSEEACGRVLVEAVRQAVRERRAGLSRPVEMAPPRPDPPDAGLLPPVSRSWERYANAAAVYASGPPPEPGPRSRLRIAAPLEPAGEGLWRLDDPAWPAVFRLDAEDLALARLCEEEIPVPAAEARGADLARMRRLIADGLLLASEARP